MKVNWTMVAVLSIVALFAFLIGTSLFGGFGGFGGYRGWGMMGPGMMGGWGFAPFGWACWFWWWSASSGWSTPLAGRRANHRLRQPSFARTVQSLCRRIGGIAPIAVRLCNRMTNQPGQDCRQAPIACHLSYPLVSNYMNLRGDEGGDSDRVDPDRNRHNGQAEHRL